MLSLIMPTLNRSSFVINYIDYLEKSGFVGELIIGDSSNEEHFGNIKRHIEDIKIGFRVQQVSCPNLKIAPAIVKSLPYITYDHATYICDDDFINVDIIPKCIQFLKDNPEYSAVAGKISFLNLNLEGELFDCRLLKHRELLDDDPICRLDNLFSNYFVVAYGIFRTKDFLTRWPKTDKCNDVPISCELLPCAMIAVQGKTKVFDDFFCTRIIHHGRYNLPRLTNWVRSPLWKDSCDFFINFLATELYSKLENKISLKNAEETIDIIFSKYMAVFFKRAFNHNIVSSHYSVNPKLFLDSEYLKRIKNNIGKVVRDRKVRRFVQGNPHVKFVESYLRSITEKIDGNSLSQQ